MSRATDVKVGCWLQGLVVERVGVSARYTPTRFGYGFCYGLWVLGGGVVGISSDELLA